MSQRAIYVQIVTKYDRIWYTQEGMGGIIGRRLMNIWEETYEYNVQFKMQL